jgi:hypothetical protein
MARKKAPVPVVEPVYPEERHDKAEHDAVMHLFELFGVDPEGGHIELSGRGGGRVCVITSAEGRELFHSQSEGE